MVALRSDVLAEGETLLNVWRPRIQRDAFQTGARNLALYLALRRRDLRPLQRTLGRWGLSSLGRSESHVQPTLDAVVALLEAACRVNEPGVCPFPTEESFFHGAQTIAQEAEAIFGPGGHGRDTRIMVTLPPEAAQDATFATEIMRHGAECVRINCAHDTPAIWEAMLANLHHAAQTLGTSHRVRVLMDLGGPKCAPCDLARGRRAVFVGDTLLLTHNMKGKRKDGPPRVGCTIPSILEQLQVGAPVWIDDGEIGARVTARTEDGVLLEIEQAPPDGKKIRTDKGLDFPDTDLEVAPLTAKDREGLAFVVRHADMIGYSFVQSAADVELLQDELARTLPADRAVPALVLKIETRRAVRHLPEIIVQAASHLPTAVMIARGDLAVEVGYERLTEIQEEILWLCEAAHVPVIWATQVLERLAKEGYPRVRK